MCSCGEERACRSSSATRSTYYGSTHSGSTYYGCTRLPQQLGHSLVHLLARLWQHRPPAAAHLDVVELRREQRIDLRRSLSRARAQSEQVLAHARAHLTVR